MKFEFLDIGYEPCPPGQMPARFGFECPKGNGMRSGLRLRIDGEHIGGPTWMWNGDRDKPTFMPSINCIDCSHGFITAGVWRDA